MLTSTTTPASAFDTAADTAHPSPTTDGYGAASEHSSSSNITDMYSNSPTLSSGLSYNMTSVSSSTTSSLPPLLPGEMVLAHEHLVTIISFSIHPLSSNLQYAVQTPQGEVFITSPDTISLVPPLPPAVKSSATQSTTPSSHGSTR